MTNENMTSKNLLRPKLDKIGQVHDKHIHEVKRTGPNSKQHVFCQKQ